MGVIEPVAADAPARPLRIAMVTTFYPPMNFGGDGQYVRRLAQALARRGCQVEVIYDGDAWRALTGSPDAAPEPEPEPPGVTVHRLQSGWPLGAVLMTQQLGRPVAHGAELRRLLARDFDVIHYHNISLIGGPGVLSYGDALKLYTAHEHWLVCPTHVLWRHNRELCTGRECFKCTLAHRRPPQLWRLTDKLERACENVDIFIALSRSTADNHRAFGFKREMTLMPSFLGAEERLAVAKPAPPPERPFFLFVGRLEVIKGLQDVIPLFDESMPADLVIAGAGAYEPQLRRLAEGRPNVRFIGHTRPEDLAILYRQATALLATSRCYEVFPMVILEAFREGAPVVARRLGPYPEIIEASSGGLVFGDAGELRAAMMRLIAEPGLRTRMGEAGREAVNTRWSEATAIDSYLDLVETSARARGRIAAADAAAATSRARNRSG